MPLRKIFIILMFLLLAIAQAVPAEVVDISSSDDAQVVEGYPTSNYGDRTYMYIQSANSAYKDERAWIKFNLEGRVPEGAVITSAKLRLYCWKSEDNLNLATAVHSSDTDSWDENSITWNTQPAYNSPALDDTVTFAADAEYIWYEWDVKSFVETQMTGDKKASFVVKPVNEGLSTVHTFAVDGKEYSAALAPRLRIEYMGTWSSTNAFKIFHMNDIHSRLIPHDFDIPETNDYPVYEKVGGAAYAAAKILELKGDNPDSLILDAGDVSEGNPLGDLSGNGGLIRFYNLLDAKLKALGGRGIDAVVVGNHDVRSLSMIQNMKAGDSQGLDPTFPVISVNVCEEGTQTPYFDPYVVREINGVTIGILGYTTDESSYPGDDTVNLLDVVECVWSDSDTATIDLKDKVEYLRTTEGCDVVILLAHIGHSRVVSGDDALLADTGDVMPPEVVIAGHWHTWTETAWQPTTLNGLTLIDEAASYLQYVAELEVSENGKYLGAVKHPVRNSEITPDGDVQTLVNTLITEYNDTSPDYFLDDVIGYSAVDLSMDKDKWWTVSEYPWNATNAAGSWITDAMVWGALQKGVVVDLAMQTGGGIRRDVPAGEITYAEIYEAYPWQDDNMVTVQMTGQEIWDFIEDNYCGASISDGWLVTAEDGVIQSITIGGQGINPSEVYTVAVSEYMAEHEDGIAGKTPTAVGYSIREAVVDFTSQYSNPASPMYSNGISTRYILDTELAGGFQAVVTMVADAESQPYYEAAFIRLISATDETLQRRNSYGLSDLVNSDGSINPDHQFSETMLYRSHLGFRDGWLENGDIIEVWGEGGFYSGNPQLVDQHGIWEAETEMKIVGRDETLSLPQTVSAVSDFWDEAHENHYVRFYAEKTGSSQLTDMEGTVISVYKEGGFYSASLPGNVGDILEVAGVNTMRFTQRRFRLDTATVMSDGYPPFSKVDAIFPYEQSGPSITLTATAGDYNGTSVGEPDTVSFYYRYADDGFNWDIWTLIGTDTDAGDGWGIVFTFPQSYGYYEFYSIAEDADENIEAAPVRADTKARFTDGSNTSPHMAMFPSIPDGQTEVDGNVTLTVTVSDPDADVVDVYFYAVSGPEEELIGTVTGVATGWTASVQWTGLSDADEYQWYVVVDDGENATESDTWTFYTAGWNPDPGPIVSVPAVGSVTMVALMSLLFMLGIYHRGGLRR